MTTQVFYDGTLEGFFALLDRFWDGVPPGEPWPRRIGRKAAFSGPASGDAQGLLFDGDIPASRGAGVPPPLLPDPAALNGAAGLLFRVSADTYDALVRVWMSCLPVEAEALRHALRVLSAAKRAVAGAAAAGPADDPASGPVWHGREEARRAAALAARNRLDDDCRTTLSVSCRVAHEVDRLMGFLRFSPDARGRYTARCSPDYFVLPALAPHFARRFGDSPWALIDEKRGLALLGGGRGEARPAGEIPGEARGPAEAWDDLWRCYHRAVCIEDRKNPALQRRFIPLRYRNYLDEFTDSPAPSATPAASGTAFSGPRPPEIAAEKNCN